MTAVKGKVIIAAVLAVALVSTLVVGSDMVASYLERLTLSSTTLAKPQVLQPGFGVTYALDPMLVINETAVDPDDPCDVGLNGWIGRGGVYSWRVESLDGSDAVLRVDLNLCVEDAYVQTRHWLNRTEYINVDVETRQATSANGTNLGTINYWISPDVHEGDTVSIYGKPPYEMREKIRSAPSNPLQIAAGNFDCWTTLSFTRPDIPELSGHLYLWFDKGTGILVAASGFFYYDVVMMTMGIEAIEIIGSWGYSGGSISSQPTTFVLQSQGTSPLI